VSTDESWLAVQVDHVLDRVAEEELVKAIKAWQARAIVLLTRAEEIKAMRAPRGRGLGEDARRELRAIHDELHELARLIVTALPDPERSAWEAKLCL
jgi:hypothetical protein